MTGAKPKTRSRKTVVVPTTEPRSPAGTRETASDRIAGIVNATPTAKTTVPTSSPTVIGTRPMIARPAADNASAAPDRRAAPNRAGQGAATSPRTTAVTGETAGGSAGPRRAAD